LLAFRTMPIGSRTPRIHLCSVLGWLHCLLNMYTVPLLFDFFCYCQITILVLLRQCVLLLRQRVLPPRQCLQQLGRHIPLLRQHVLLLRQSVLLFRQCLLLLAVHVLLLAIHLTVLLIAVVGHCILWPAFSELCLRLHRHTLTETYINCLLTSAVISIV
jgi:hypothetical protein